MAEETLKLLLLGEDRSASKALKGVGDEADKVGKKTSIAGGVMKGALGATIVAEGAKAIVGFGVDSVKAYQDAAKSQRQLEDAYKRFPAISDVSISKQRELNQAIQDKTGADADDIASSQSVLARYKLTGSQISAMTPLMVDYAKRTGKDLPAAGTTLGKALGGNAKAMKELGIKFKDTGDPAKNFDAIMKGLQEKVGGFAESEASTLDGKLDILQTKFGDVQEEIGAQLLPVMLQLADGAKVLVDWISQNASWLGPLAAGLGIAAGAMMLLNVAMTANPIGIIVVAIGALVGALIYAYQNSETFRTVVDTAFRAIGAAGRWLWNNALAPALRAIVGGFAWVTDGLAGMLEGLGSIPGFEWAKTAAANLRGVAKGAREAADGIKDIPEPDLTFHAKDKASVTIHKIDTEIKKLKGKVVEAKAKGDSKAVEALQKKINALKSKKVDITANVRKTGISGIVVKVTSAGTVKVGVLAAGGIVRRYAAGGIEDHSPHIYRRMDGARLFNEPETQGESYIPLANDWRRPRAVAIWRQTGRELGQFAAGGVASARRGGVSVGLGGDSYTINATVARGVDPLAFAREVEAELGALKTRNRKLAFQGV